MSRGVARVDSKSRHQNQHHKITRLFSRLLSRLTKKKKNTEQKQLTLEIMISQFYLTCDNTDITSTQLHIYNIHSVFFGEKIHHKIVVGIMDGNSLEMTINHNEGLRTQT